MRQIAGGFLTRLARDKRGNTLAVMAIALIPLLGFVGSAVDTARLYVVKVRLQQACDAGVLAGRKFMTSSSSTRLDDNAAAQALIFFNNNFDRGLFGSTAVSFTPTKTTDNQVAGSATATVPMTLTAMMGFNSNVLSVNCEARLDVADLDIMFVLDTTGSMAYLATDKNLGGQPVNAYQRGDQTTGYYTTEKNGARIKALRTAVLNFYDTIAAAADATTKIRYGFVPYSSTVNVGKIIPASMLVSGTHSYSTRRPSERDAGTTYETYSYKTGNWCNSNVGRTPGSGYSNGVADYRTANWSRYRNRTDGECVVATRRVELYWTFGSISTDVSSFVAGNRVSDPSKLNGAQSKWQGCIEERDTTASGSFSQSNLPGDLDPDLPATTDATRWRPMWPDLIYQRNGNRGSVYVSNATAQGSNYANIGDPSKLELGRSVCPKEAKRLGVMSRLDVANYVNHADFRPMGGTYHDVGMIWGTRFLSPKGPFKEDTAAWPGRKEPLRHIVFMTDGAMLPNLDGYNLYGYEQSDRRVTGDDTTRQLARHNARFLAECKAAQDRQITVWVIAFGEDLTPEMKECASSAGHAFEAASDAKLNAAFQSIAARVAMLRISK